MLPRRKSPYGIENAINFKSPVELFRKLFSFALIGVINTATDWGVFWSIGVILSIQSQYAWAAKVISYSVGVIISYILNSRHTFKAEACSLKQAVPGQRKTFIKFVVVSLLCMLLNMLAYWLLQSDQYFDLMALTVATLLAFIVGFSLNHLWTFRVQK